MKLFVKGGFTIIELLVSITVIAILSSLLLVTLSQSRRKVHAVVCLSNLRQINLGWQIAIDTDDNGFGWRWPGALYTHSEFLGSAQGKWWASEWGNTNRSSICPAAPQRLEKDRPAAGLNALGHYTGAYNTAWTADVRTKRNPTICEPEATLRMDG
jgi:prepilin-type N-terminal cleavage/methylation domain-containing protein